MDAVVAAAVPLVLRAAAGRVDRRGHALKRMQGSAVLDTDREQQRKRAVRTALLLAVAAIACYATFFLTRL